MPRLHLFEWEDLPWFPHVWRNYMTDILMQSFTRMADRVPAALDSLDRLLDAAGTDNIVDLCSGSSGALLWFRQRLEERRVRPVRVVLTDKFPNLERFEELARASDGRVAFRRESIDATDVPVDLDGIRTVCLAFHHFRPDVAQKILRDAASHRRAIAVFEAGERSWLATLIVLIAAAPTVWLATPFIRPFRWSRLLWTYLIPVVPLAVTWDGAVSCLRCYTPKELREMAASIGAQGYEWEAGCWPVRGAPVRATYLLGYPKS